MRIAIGTDASLKIGTCHVMRCLTLADKLRERRDECHFICQQPERIYTHQHGDLNVDHRAGFEIVSIETPGQLDVDIGCRACLSNQTNIDKAPFWNKLFTNRFQDLSA